MNHDPLCGWATRPGEWEALAASSPEPPTECSTCAEITRVRADEREACAQAVEGWLFRKNGSGLHSVGSGFDEGGIEFCCSCESNAAEATELVARIRARGNVTPDE